MLVSELGGSRQRACARARLLASRPREEAAAAAAALPPVAQRAPFGHKRDELAAGAKDRTGWAVRIAWRPLHHAAGCASAAGHWRRAQRRGAALPVELHDARVRGDGAAQGGAHGVGRAHCAPAQLPNSWQDEPVRVHPGAAPARGRTLRTQLVPRHAAHACAVGNCSQEFVNPSAWAQHRLPCWRA